MKKILYLRTNSFQCEPHVGSIVQFAEQSKEYEVIVKDYFVADVDNQVTEWVAHYQPDYLVWLGVCGSVYQPTPTRFWIFRKSGVKTIMLCPEASHPDWDKVIKEFHEHDSFDLIVNLDGNEKWDKRDKGFTTLAIFDQRPYRKPQLPLKDRPIDVGFCGGVGFTGTMRQRLVDHFKKVSSLKFEELPFKFSWQGGESYQEYADFMMSCKIIINPAHSSNENVLHVKGRVIETGLAGCMLLEQNGSPINEWFSGEVCYFFETPQTAENVARYILSELRIGSDYAHPYPVNLQKQVLEKYSPDKLWSAIFNKLNGPASNQTGH